MKLLLCWTDNFDEGGGLVIATNLPVFSFPYPKCTTTRETECLIFYLLWTKYLFMTRSTPDIGRSKAQQFTIRRIDKIFKFYKPKPPLSNFVDSLWLHEGRVAAHQAECILPTGTLELAINLRQNELRFYDPERPENRSCLSGSVVSGAHGRGFAPNLRGRLLSSAFISNRAVLFRFSDSQRAISPILMSI